MMPSDRYLPSQAIAECLDRLEAVLAEPVPFFNPVRRAARDAEARELVDRLREAVARELREGADARAEAEAVLRQAQDEARRLVVEAQEYARRLRGSSSPSGSAEGDEQQVREQAIRDAEEVRRGADAYALRVLERLEGEVDRILATVRRGKAVLLDRGAGGSGTSAGNGRPLAPEGITQTGRAGTPVR